MPLTDVPHSGPRYPDGCDASAERRDLRCRSRWRFFAGSECPRAARTRSNEGFRCRAGDGPSDLPAACAAHAVSPLTHAPGEAASLPFEPGVSEPPGGAEAPRGDAGQPDGRAPGHETGYARKARIPPRSNVLIDSIPFDNRGVGRPHINQASARKRHRGARQRTTVRLIRFVTALRFSRGRRYPDCPGIGPFIHLM